MRVTQTKNKGNVAADGASSNPREWKKGVGYGSHGRRYTPEGIINPYSYYGRQLLLVVVVYFIVAVVAVVIIRRQEPSLEEHGHVVTINTGPPARLFETTPMCDPHNGTCFEAPNMVEMMIPSSA